MNKRLQQIIAAGLISRMESIDSEACTIYMNYQNGNISKKIYNHKIKENTKALKELFEDANSVGFSFRTKSFKEEVCMYSVDDETFAEWKNK